MNTKEIYTMKKILFTILTFFAMFIAFGQQGVLKYQKNLLMEYLLNYERRDINLAQGIDVSKLPSIAKISDFSKPYVANQEYSMSKWSVDSDNNYVELSPATYFYNIDFSEDPFDGKIQILVMGEPLPSPLTTLICCFGVIGILLYYKKKKEVIV